MYYLADRQPPASPKRRIWLLIRQSTVLGIDSVSLASARRDAGLLRCDRIEEHTVEAPSLKRVFLRRD
jgi:hypothetical protein